MECGCTYVEYLLQYYSDLCYIRWCLRACGVLSQTVDKLAVEAMLLSECSFSPGIEIVSSTHVYRSAVQYFGAGFLPNYVRAVLRGQRLGAPYGLVSFIVIRTKCTGTCRAFLNLVDSVRGSARAPGGDRVAGLDVGMQSFGARPISVRVHVGTNTHAGDRRQLINYHSLTSNSVQNCIN